MGKRLTIVGVVFLAAIFAALLATYAPWEESSAPSSTVVRLNAPFPAIDFAPFYVAKTKGWLEESLSDIGSKPDYVGSFGEIALSNESLATNRIDMLLTSGIPPIIGRSGGIDMRIVWLSCTLMSEIAIPSSSPATKLVVYQSNNFG
uniref:Uncharacterized protein n=1 Tax=Candidatus Kentrum eta TaxID=2126337 RepID=A0A450UKP2_9GAMM|nr:MAG: hypothetical protein BECKH772A_GA0070896_1005119 [Candidatus Kentron sp. H]VFJ93753.1 MAG: hypothetical protein BECKH772B_GA0070898_1004919 [Candidatus Kentron sp. H]VFK00591.1 MAG: hypothetical protein BECKH772C_GA0070978_1004819 [Candidatus Kentron sp. H]